MSQVSNQQVKSFVADNALANPYRIVKLGADTNSVDLATANSDVQIGVTNELTPAAGEEVGVVISGTAKVVIALATTKGDYITATALGKGQSAGAGDKYVGVLLETTTIADQVAEVVIAPGELN